MLTRRLGVAVAVLGGSGSLASSQQLYAVGGSDGDQSLSSVEYLDPRVGFWQRCPSMGFRRKHLGVAVYNGLIYAVGGRDDASELSSVECYDPRAHAWCPMVAMTLRRSGVGLAVVNNQLVAIGGFDGVTYLKSVEVYSPEAKCWLPHGSMNSRRLGGGFGVIRIPSPPICFSSCPNNYADNPAGFNDQASLHSRTTAPLSLFSGVGGGSGTTGTNEHGSLGLSRTPAVVPTMVNAARVSGTGFSSAFSSNENDVRLCGSFERVEPSGACFHVESMIGGAVADFGTGSTGHGCDGRGAVTTSHRSLRGPNSGIDVSLSTTSPASFCSHSDSSFLDMRQPALPLDSVARLLTTTSSSSFACSSLSGCRNSSSSKDTLVITTTASSTSFAARCPLTTGHYTLPSPAFFDAVVPLLESGKPDDLILQPISSIISTVTSSSPASLLADQLSASPGSSNLASIGHPNSMHSGISTANGQSGVEIVPSGDDIPTYPS